LNWQNYKTQFNTLNGAINMAHHPEENSNISSNEHFDQVLVQASISRRSLFKGGVGLMAVWPSQPSARAFWTT
jgi:hypothetical protein